MKAKTTLSIETDNADSEGSPPHSDESVTVVTATPCKKRKVKGEGDTAQPFPPLPPAGQFTKSAQKRRKAKAKRQLERERAAAAAADSANPNSAGFSYSVKYFNWAVSSSESDGDDDDDDNDCCPTVVLPVSMARMRLNESRKS